MTSSPEMARLVCLFIMLSVMVIGLKFLGLW